MARKKATTQTQDDPQAAATTEVDLRIPLAEISPPAYCPHHVQVQLDDRQALAFKRLHAGLDAAEARLANGRRVASGADALRWLLEQLAG